MDVKFQNSSARPRHCQRGAVLVISLILLLVLTMLAVGSLRGTAMEEKMAGNSHDRNLAFQSAESGVREAEVFLEGIASPGVLTGTGGLFAQTDAVPDFTDPETWSDGANHRVAAAPYGAYEPPRYYIQHLTTVPGTTGALNLVGYGDNKGSGDVTIFRITGRGTGGGADSAEVILRSQYGRIF
jgi:type IV pilus assembly protein PilX